MEGIIAPLPELGPGIIRSKRSMAAPKQKFGFDKLEGVYLDFVQPAADYYYSYKLYPRSIKPPRGASQTSSLVKHVQAQRPEINSRISSILAQYTASKSVTLPGGVTIKEADINGYYDIKELKDRLTEVHTKFAGKGPMVKRIFYILADQNKPAGVKKDMLNTKSAKAKLESYKKVLTADEAEALIIGTKTEKVKIKLQMFQKALDNLVATLENGAKVDTPLFRKWVGAKIKGNDVYNNSLPDKGKAIALKLKSLPYHGVVRKANGVFYADVKIQTSKDKNNIKNTILAVALKPISAAVITTRDDGNLYVKIPKHKDLYVVTTRKSVASRDALELKYMGDNIGYYKSDGADYLKPKSAGLKEYQEKLINKTIEYMNNSVPGQLKGSITIYNYKDEQFASYRKAARLNAMNELRSGKELKPSKRSFYEGLL